jgi:hypothetical protein
MALDFSQETSCLVGLLLINQTSDSEVWFSSFVVFFLQVISQKPQSKHLARPQDVFLRFAFTFFVLAFTNGQNLAIWTKLHFIAWAALVKVFISLFHDGRSIFPFMPLATYEALPCGFRAFALQWLFRFVVHDAVSMRPLMERVLGLIVIDTDA